MYSALNILNYSPGYVLNPMVPCIPPRIFPACVPGHAVNPSMGAWARHPCLTQSRNAGWEYPGLPLLMFPEIAAVSEANQKGTNPQNFTTKGKRVAAVRFALPGPCEAMDGRARAHTDVLVACPGRPNITAATRASETNSTISTRATTLPNHRRQNQILIESALLFTGAHPVRDEDDASFPTIVKDITPKP